MYRKTYIEINTQALTHNVKTIVSSYPGYSHYIGVVKGGAYGHGYASIKALLAGGVQYLAVSTLEEALAIRAEGIDAPILCLQPIHTADIASAVEKNITITISNYDFYTALLSQSITHPVKVHLKINSGFNRLGISNKEQVQEIVQALKQHLHIELEGIFSHFATTGMWDKYWDMQLARFKEVTSSIDLGSIKMVHLGRSLTLLNHPKIDFCTAVRIGITMYGYDQMPKQQTGLRAFLRNLKRTIHARMNHISQTIKKNMLALTPAFRLYSEIIEIQDLKKGDHAGYGPAFIAEKNCRIGVVSIGYADGFFRSNKGGDVAIAGTRYKILAVDMGMLSILVDETVHIYDKVEIIGEIISAQEVARRNNTTVYEILCVFKESVPRILTAL
jgi:alanine racemase